MRSRWLLLRAAFLGAIAVTGAVSTLSLRADPVSQATHFIATWEGFSATPYQDQAGCWTVGFGHLLTCDEDWDPEGWGTVTEEDAEAWLRQTVGTILDHVVFDLRGRVLDDEKLAALVSLAYNIGETAFHGSRLLQMIWTMNRWGDRQGMLSWDHVNGEVSRGLSRRGSPRWACTSSGQGTSSSGTPVRNSIRWRPWLPVLPPSVRSHPSF